MKTLVGGFRSRRFSRRDLDSSSRGRRISHKKRKSRRKGRRFYGKKSRRKMMGGDIEQLRIIVEYNKNATREEDIGFKIKRIEGGDNSGMGNRDRIIINYENCEKTRNDLITKLFPKIKINPTSATNAIIGVSASSSTGKQNIADKLVDEILTPKNIDLIIGKVKEIANNPQEFIDKTKQSFDEIKKIVKYNMGDDAYYALTDTLEDVIDVAGSLATDVAIQQLDNLKEEVLNKLTDTQKKKKVGEIFKKTRNTIIKNNQNFLGASAEEKNSIVNETIKNFSQKQKDELPEQIKKILEIKSTNKPTSTTSTEPMSKEFKESFMLAMALKMFDENDDAEMVDNTPMGVVGVNPVVDNSETINYPEASVDSKNIINAVKVLIEKEEYVNSFNSQYEQDNKQNNIQNIKKANEYINNVRESIHNIYIPNSTNKDTDVNKIIDTAKEIINNSSVITDEQLLRQNPKAETERQEKIQILMNELNSLITPRNVIPSTDTYEGYGPKNYPSNFSQPIMNSSNIDNYILNKIQDPPPPNKNYLHP